MAELSVDQTRDAYMKAQAEVKRAADDLAVKQSEVIRAQAEMATAKTSEQINATTRSLVALDTQARDTDPANDPALRRLANERAIAETKLLALQGCKQREQAQLGKAETDVVKAEHALAQAKTLLQKAKDDATSAMYDAEEARLIAAKEPLPQHLAERAARRERVEERQRQIENDWDWNDVRRLWDPGEAVLSRDQHDAAQLLFLDCIREARLARKTLSREQLRARTQECISAARDALAVATDPETKIDPAAAGEHKWRKTVPPVSQPIEPVSTVSGGTKWDPSDPLAED